MKVLFDTNVYVGACASAAAQARFRTSFLPLLPLTVLSAVVAYELRVNASDEPTRRLVDQWVGPMERSGRVVTPTFADWLEAADIVTRIFDRDRRWRSKLPGPLNDVLIALCARRVGATLITARRPAALNRGHRPTGATRTTRNLRPESAAVCDAGELSLRARNHTAIRHRKLP